ncbi:hypothetical protein [Actinoalloteichus caeruleus]|uniref:Uncharacterized protein n=1 Tax=Actinoalloteichus caeruleus DSM 43889 TaxID=1120930 RepID=A0ABT1JMV3_ACTCY|nr:hypothetical protein [Actinoalloteichus caeruleus]MCP2333589.1 hypothetical protein [Actinoalloteichus caeruleus DSM 43889]
MDTRVEVSVHSSEWISARGRPPTTAMVIPPMAVARSRPRERSGCSSSCRRAAQIPTRNGDSDVTAKSSVLTGQLASRIAASVNGSTVSMAAAPEPVAAIAPTKATE